MSTVLPLEALGIIILLAIGFSIFVKKTGQNAVLGYIIAGFLLGPMFLSFLSPTDPLVTGFSELGLFVLLFYLGIEMSLKDFLKAGSSAIGLAILDMSACAAIGFSISYLAGFSIFFSMVVAIMTFSTSTAIVAKFAFDKGIIQHNAMKHAISLLILQDFVGIVILGFLTTFSAHGGTGSDPLGLAIAAIVFTVAVFFAVSRLSRLVEDWLTKNGFGHTEITLYALGIGLIVATLGTLLGLSMALGAYFAGFALAETKSGERIKKDVGFLREFMLVFFFVGFGTLLFFNPATSSIQIPELNTLIFLGEIAILLAVGAIIMHAVVTKLFGGAFGLSREDSTIVAILLVPLGEFVVIIATSALPALHGAESALLAPIAFLLILVTVILFQPLYNLRGLHQKIFDFLPSLFTKAPEKSDIREHTPFTIGQLKKFTGNIFVVLCFAWVTVLLYETLPSFGVPLLYSREVTSFVIFCFFAFYPAFQAAKSLRHLILHAMKRERRILKRFAFKG
ncbi:Glutathione-regulated potassium-efflux system protein KefB [uncultured archaeon]|nr:Glutathione-regulated potassium-efflux system protein KefB [uncultured archaeon]